MALFKKKKKKQQVLKQIPDSSMYEENEDVKFAVPSITGETSVKD